MTHRRIVYQRSLFLLLVVCLLTTMPVVAAETDTLTPPAKSVPAGAARPADRNAVTETGSYVDHVTRKYSTEGPELSVKVPGGRLSVGLSYEHGVWLAGPARSGLEGLPVEGSGLTFHDIGDAQKGEAITAIVKDGRYSYDLPDDRIRLRKEYADDGSLISQQYEYVGERVYLHRPDMGMLRIVATDDGFREIDKFGEWTDYDSEGRMVASGTRLGETERALYDSEGRVAGYTDRDGTQRIWINYENGKVSTIRDAGGRSIGLSYDGDGRLQSATDVLGHSTSYAYNQDGLLSEVSKPGGRQVKIEYNEGGNVKSVLDAAERGHYFSFDYDDQKDEYYASVESTSGLVKEYWYDEEGDTQRIDINGLTVKTITKESDGRVLLITDERGSTTRQEYDEWTNLTKVTYPDGSSESYQYEHKYNQLIKAVNIDGVMTTYDYDDQGNLILMIEAAGTEREWKVEYTYNNYGGRITMRKVETIGDEGQRVTEEVYDEDGNRLRLVEAAGSEFERVTEYEYDSDGNLTAMIKYLDEQTQAVTHMEYDDAGNLQKFIEPQGNETTLTYTDDGNIESMTTVQGIWRFNEDEKGRLVSIEEPSGTLRRWKYDDLDRPLTMTLNGNIARTYTYDDRGNLIQQTDAAGNISQFQYNTEGQRTLEIDPEGTRTHYVYDDDGQLIKTIDGNGNEIVREYGDASTASCVSCSEDSIRQQLQKIIYPTFTKEFQYDAQGRIIEEISILDGGEHFLMSYIYDQFGRLASKTGPDGTIIRYQYDLMNRLIRLTEPAGPTSFEYDRWDLLQAVTDAKGNTTRFEYDLTGRPVKEIRPMGQETTYEYDDRLWSLRQFDSKQQTTEYLYDKATGKVTQSTRHTASGEESQMWTLTYDQAGNITGYNDGVTSAVYTYDAMNRKTSETVNYGAFELTYSYSYAKNGLKKNVTMPDGTRYEYAYGENNELQEIRLPAAGAITLPEYSWNKPATLLFPGGSRREYGYDSLMRPQTIQAKDPGQHLVLDYQYTYDAANTMLWNVTEHGEYRYTYDASSQLTSAEYPFQDNEVFTYDAVGNRITGSAIEGVWAYDKNNRLLGMADREYDYDENGNMIQQRKGGEILFTYRYNAANRLIAVEDGNHNMLAEYYYDPFGRRLWKEVQGTRTYFLYADEGLIGEYDADGNELTSYGYTPNATWTTNPLFLKHGDTYYFYQTDHLGTPIMLMKSNGAIVWSAHYQAFGEAVIEVSSVVNNLRLPGQYYDEETGLHYNWHRYYDPALGRYLRLDPRGIKEGMNLYVYARNNPLKFLDIDGRGIGCALAWAVATTNSQDPLYRLPEHSGMGPSFPMQPSCPIAMIGWAMATHRSTFSKYQNNYDPHVNGYNALHCYANCLIAKYCAHSENDFSRLLDANLTYEICTRKEEICTKWCMNTYDYGRDVKSDYDADALGICGGLDKGDCGDVCASQIQSDGPNQRDENDKCMNIECCDNLLNNPTIYPVPSPTNIYNMKFPPGTRDYKTQCSRIYP